ncbi:MAG TPA: TIGR03546 family protein [Elusimicrobiota bacterium]|nr:TIGR03546 family protein [Elusimicrobiota bacterium]
MITIKLILKLINILNKEASPRQIAAGIALGSIAGITPTASLHNLPVLVLILLLRVNISSAFVSLAAFSAFSYFLDPLFNKIGYALLTLPALKHFWTELYNTPLLAWTNFNNTLTLGSLVFALLLFGPLYFVLAWAVKTYREKFLEKVRTWKIVQMLKASKLYGLYASYS